MTTETPTDQKLKQDDDFRDVRLKKRGLRREGSKLGVLEVTERRRRDETPDDDD